ncbi:MAG TPA: cytotoxin [Thermodesulfobacteriota bacterium]|nr:cytotoxin [Thermodesulfobacteriota bacterium]
MAARVSPFELHFEILFLENYSRLKPAEQKAIDKAIRFLSANPRHPSLNVHKAKNIKGKYAEGGNDVFIAYPSKGLRFTFEYGPSPGTIALRNCGHHEPAERKM